MNLTITVDNNVLKQARIRAIREDTSVNAVVREFLASYAEATDRRQEAARRFTALARAATSSRGNATWTRDELHER